MADIKVTHPNLKKLDDRSIRTMFIGYENGCSTIYRVYDPAAKRVYVTHDDIFDEAASWDWGAAPADREPFIIEYTPSAIGEYKLEIREKMHRILTNSHQPYQ